MKAIVLSGGSGTRLWPVSRQKQPKQMQAFIGRDTLLEMTIKRLLKFLKPDDIYLTTSEEQYPLIKKLADHLGLKKYCIEPQRRNTAAAIGLAAAYIHKQFPEETVCTVNTDHYIHPVATYIKFVKLADRVLHSNPKRTVLIGINPTYPETGYGYIKMGSQKEVFGKDEVFKVERFIEKPNLATAQKFLQQWEYLWNAGMFFWRVDYLMSLYKKFLPATYRNLMTIEKNIGTKKETAVIRREFAKIKPISIDYGIMEKEKQMLVIPADFTWRDIGDWRSVKDALSKNAIDNVVKGHHVGIETTSSLIYSMAGKLIATAGVDNLVIIDTHDTLLVCHRNHAQNVKQIVELLEQTKKHRYL